jgi:hypothetical protein
MTERKTLKCSPDTKARFDQLKRDGETTDGLLNRAFDALEADEDIEPMLRRVIREELGENRDPD